MGEPFRLKVTESELTRVVWRRLLPFLNGGWAAYAFNKGTGYGGT